jgi:flagellar protein FlgJ
MATPLDSALQNVGTWTQLSGFDALRSAARSDGASALPAVARQFESIFTQMMLKSMREANAGLGEALGDSQAGQAWRDVFDQQLALSLSGTGKGLGIADMLVRQLGGKLQQAAAVDASGGTGGGAADEGDLGDPAALPANADEFQRRLAAVIESGREVGRSAMKWLPQDAREFVHALAPYAQAAAKRLGLSVRTVLAQAALETQWGRHMPRAADGSTSFNLFGIKAGGNWDGRKVSVPTVEYEDGVAVRKRAQFRAYDSPAQAFADYAELLASNPRYAKAQGHGDDVHGFARALVAGGYATDPAYARKIAAIADSEVMRDALASLKDAGQLPTD